MGGWVCEDTGCTLTQEGGAGRMLGYCLAWLICEATLHGWLIYCAPIRGVLNYRVYLDCCCSKKCFPSAEASRVVLMPVFFCNGLRSCHICFDGEAVRQRGRCLWVFGYIQLQGEICLRLSVRRWSCFQGNVIEGCSCWVQVAAYHLRINRHQPV